MKLRNILLVCTVFSIMLPQLFAQNSTPVVSNSRFEQRTDGSFKVDIFYDVSDADGDQMTVSIRVSSDGGVTWNFPATKFKDGSDIGEGITSGTNKQIVWDFGVEHPETFGDQFMIEISADDESLPMGFPCPDTPTVTYSGKTYNTVQIGEQCWLKENLDVGTMITSNSSNDHQTDNGTVEKYCYNNDPNNCDTYGGLYQRNEAMQYVTTDGAQGICPSGWHIPTTAEQQTLSITVGGDGNALKVIGQGIGNGLGTNTSGFSALLTGKRDDSNFSSLRYYTHFWSSTEGGSLAGYMSLFYLSGTVYFVDYFGFNNDYGFSVRCLKNEGTTILPPNIPSNPIPADSSESIDVNTTLLWNCSDPNEDLLTYDIYFGTSSNPSLAESDLSNSSYTPPLLDNNTTYYWKVVAKNSNGGVTEGPIWRFKTEVGTSETCPPTVTYAGKIYNTVLIGDQCWFKENLDVGTMINGSSSQSNNSSIEKYCYNNDAANCDTYGGLYQWDEAMQYLTAEGVQGICPDGWHIPILSEFETLDSFVDGDGNALKAVGQGSGNGSGTNTSGFSSLLTGYRSSNGEFLNLNISPFYWSSTQENNSGAFDMRLHRDFSNIFYLSDGKDRGFSVRCLKNSP